jgi:hypothetical protein
MMDKKYFAFLFMAIMFLGLLKPISFNNIPTVCKAGYAEVQFDNSPIGIANIDISGKFNNPVAVAVTAEETINRITWQAFVKNNQIVIVGRVEDAGDLTELVTVNWIACEITQ